MEMDACDEEEPRLTVAEKWRENIATNLNFISHYANLAAEACAVNDDTLAAYSIRKLTFYLDAAKASLIDLLSGADTDGRP